MTWPGRVYEPLAPVDFLRFADSLSEVPFHDPNWLFVTQVAPGEPRQGDIVDTLPLAYVNTSGGAVLLAGRAMLLGHSCDAVPEQNPLVAFAPVFPLEAFEAEHPDTAKRASRVDAIRKNRLTDKFFLPAHGDKPESYVDFGYIASVSTLLAAKEFERASASNRTRLSSSGWYLLMHKLTFHFVRTSRDSQEGPESGEE